MSADLCFTTVSSSSFFRSFFIRPLISELAERNSTRIGYMLGSNCDLRMHVQNLWHPLPLQIGAKNHLFGPISRLNDNFNGLYLRKETRNGQSVKCVDNYKESRTSSQNVMNFGPLTASNSTCILPTLRKFCILLHCQALQTEISKNGIQPNFAKRR